MKTKVLFVCLGNICRSPMAEAVCRKLLSDAKLSDEFQVDSAGTAAYHTGETPDLRVISCLDEKKIPIDHRARPLVKEDFSIFDFILTMDRQNFDDVCQMGNDEENKKVFMLSSFSERKTERNTDIKDPYFGKISTFYEVFEIIERSILGFIKNKSPNVT